MSYSIAEAATATELTADTLRYYERDGLMLRPVGRSATGHRRYEDADIRWIDMLNCLRGTGMPMRHPTLRRARAGWRGQRAGAARPAPGPPDPGARPALRGAGAPGGHRPQD